MPGDVLLEEGLGIETEPVVIGPPAPLRAQPFTQDGDLSVSSACPHFLQGGTPRGVQVASPSGPPADGRRDPVLELAWQRIDGRHGAIPFESRRPNAPMNGYQRPAVHRMRPQAATAPAGQPGLATGTSWSSCWRPATVTSQRGPRAAGYGDHMTEELPEDAARYQEISDSLRERIDSGELPPGAMLPSVTRITQEWGVSTTTAANALRLLHSEGLIRTAEGGDTFVAGPDD